MAPSKVPCNCTSHKCDGQLVTRTEQRRHDDLDKANERRANIKAKRANIVTVDKVTKLTFRMALTDGTSTLDSKCGDAFWERSSLDQTDCLTNDFPISPQDLSKEDPPAPAPPDLRPHSEGPKQKPARDSAKMLYNALVEIDVELHQHIRLVTELISESIPTVSDEPIRAERRWFQNIIHDIQAAHPGRDDATLQLRGAMVETVINIISVIDQELAKRAASVPEPVSTENTFDTSGYFTHPLRNGNSLLVIAMFLVCVLNVFGHLARPSCNFALRVLRGLVQCALKGTNTSLTDSQERLLKNFPLDVRSVRSSFDIEPVITIYATCPKCSCTHKPLRTKSKVDVYPTRCQYVRYRGGKTCGVRLVKHKVVDGESVRAPILPFAYQSFPAFVAGLMSRPGVEDMIDRAWQRSGKEELWDIWDGSAVREIPGADEKPFGQGGKDEARMVWSLSLDWFNPYMNKAAGKSASTGSMAMACLNLPPSIRHKPEYLYLGGMIPREPHVDEVNHFLRPLVDDLLPSWQSGTWYTKTHNYPNGRRAFSAVGILVSDLPGARKAAGGIGIGGEFISPFYTEQRRQDINDISIETWIRRTKASFRTMAEQWKDAPSKAARDRIFKETGIRWSELLRLPYWDPTRSVVVDAMHNLFLGLVKFHCQSVLGFQGPTIPDESEGVVPATPQEMIKARKLWAKGVTSENQLKKLKIPTLLGLCAELDIHLPRPAGGGRISKSFIIQSLMKQIPSSQPQQSNPVYHNTAPQDTRETLAEDAGMISSWFTTMVPGFDGDWANDVSRSTLDSGLPIDYYQDGQIGKEELRHVQNDIAETTRPRWQAGPPAKFGTPAAGKLKADQWRSIIEFDIPVSLIKLWAKAPLNDDNDRRRKILDSTMYLATAIRWATSHRTSEKHAAEYMRNMREYLASVRELFPERNLLPNQHNALFIGEMLLRFGPVHGWWMFPFERLIGLLQQINTNQKLGQLEVTMMKSFCAASNLKSLVRSERCPDVIQEFAPILETCYGQDGRGTLMNDLRTLDSNLSNGTGTTSDDRPWAYNRKKFERLETDVHASLVAFFNSRGYDHTPDTHALPHAQYTTGGLTYAESKAGAKNTDSRNSVIFFETEAGQPLVPGLIRKIFSMPKKDIQGNEQRLVFIAVERYKTLANTDGAQALFTRYGDFGAGLWSTTLGEVEIITPSHKMCHGIRRKWNEGAVVLKPLNRDF